MYQDEKKGGVREVGVEVLRWGVEVSRWRVEVSRWGVEVLRSRLTVE